MAELIIQTEKIKENIKTLSSFFAKHDIHWSLITKVFSGDKEFLKNFTDWWRYWKNKRSWWFTHNQLEKFKGGKS